VERVVERTRGRSKLHRSAKQRRLQYAQLRQQRHDVEPPSKQVLGGGVCGELGDPERRQAFAFLLGQLG
jgi:hypothetical protein